MSNKNSKNIVKREDRISRFATFISNMDINEEVKPTPLSKEIGIHVDSVKDIIDAYEVIKDAAKIEIIRDKKGNIKRIVRVKDENKDLIFKKEIRDAIVNISNRIDSIDENIYELKVKEKHE